MTVEEFNKGIMDIYDEQNALFSKKRRLKRRFRDELPYKVGDKVSILRGLTHEECWISDMSITDYGKIDLRAFRKNKDGKKSKASRWLGFFSPEEITLISHEEGV